MLCFSAGGNQLNPDAKYDVHQNVAEVRPMVRYEGEHGLWSRVLYGARIE